MRASRLHKLFNIKRLNKLKKDFSTPFKAFLASSGVFSSKIELRDIENNTMIVDRSDLTVWSEYFLETNSHVKITNGLFHIIPFNKQHNDYYIQGCTGGVTYLPTRRHQGNTPSLIEELQSAEKSYYSQHGEDGIIENLLKIIGVKHRYIVEFGAHDGINMSNSRYLITEKDWDALLIEADPSYFKKLDDLYKDSKNVIRLNCFVTKENINDLFHSANVPQDFDILSVDVDGPDYYLWEALTDFTPKIVIIEYNSAKPPDIEYIIPEDKIQELSATKDEGASILAFYNLGLRKGYQAIYSELYGANLFFIHQDEISKFNIDGITPLTLHQPPQFGEIAGTSALSGRGYK